jgi:glycosyltransferase involved in cell wall biosynthesis
VRVLYFGTYERHYPRNAQVVSCLRRAGVEVAEWHVPVWEDREHKFGLGLGSAARLARAQLRLLRRPPEDFDVLLVGYPGHFDMPRARRVAGERPLVFNPLLSLYDSLVHDRGRWSDGSVPARALRALDRRSMRLADVVVADTDAHADYFAALADIERGDVEVCFLGAEEPLFRPGWRRGEAFHCFFYGKMIPLHGLETILEAARLALEIPFTIAGTGQLDSMLEGTLPANVTWERWVDHDALPDRLWRTGCALGVFGTTDKAARVIPNKAFEALACGAPLVTADTPAARELLVDGESALLVPPGDPTSLADAVRRLAADPGLAERLSRGGLDVYRRRASEEALGPRWRGVLERAVDRSDRQAALV